MPSAMTLRHLKNRKKVSETGVQKIKQEMVQNKRKQPRAQFTRPYGLGNDFGFSCQWRVLNGFTFWQAVGGGRGGGGVLGEKGSGSGDLPFWKIVGLLLGEWNLKGQVWKRDSSQDGQIVGTVIRPTVTNQDGSKGDRKKVRGQIGDTVCNRVKSIRCAG